jgi:hypothetical protein
LSSPLPAPTFLRWERLRQEAPRSVHRTGVSTCECCDISTSGRGGCSRALRRSAGERRAAGHDEATGAVVLHLGDRVEQDTTQATTADDDTAINDADCGAPAVKASVWYQYTPDATGNAALDTSESDYEAGLMVFDGAPTSDSFLACGPVAVGLHFHAGTTYYVMASPTPQR